MTPNRLILGRLTSLLAILLAVPASCFAEATHKLIQVDGKKVVAVMSPDSSKAVWASDLDGEYDIYISRPDGTSRRNLTADCNSWDISPDWSPDGKRIAFVSARGGRWQVYSMDAAGNKLQQRTHEEHGVRLPKYGPHGQIAYRALHKDAKHPKYRRSDLVVIDGKRRRTLVRDTRIIDFGWGPQGKQIVCGAEGKIVLVHLADGATRTVQVTDVDQDLYRHGVFAPQWRPDGELAACLIRYLGRRLAKETVFPGEDKLFLMTPKGKVRWVPLDEIKKDEFDWVAIRPDIPIQLGKAAIDPRAEKKRVVAFFAKQGFPLKEMKLRGNVIEYAFLVGPDFKHAIGFNVLLNAAEEKAFARGERLQIAIPSYVKHDIVLWYWDMKADANGDPQFQRLFGRLKKALDDYPGPKR